MFWPSYNCILYFLKERGVSLSPFITFVCHKVFPILPVMETKESVDDILQLFAQSFLPGITAELAKDIIPLLFDMLLVSMYCCCYTVSYRETC